MKKIICFVLSVSLVLALVLPMAVSAAEVITFDWVEMGVEQGKANQVSFTEGGYRCAYSGWDSDKEYLWLIPEKNTGTTNYLKLGDSFDMSRVETITFWYVTDTDPNGKIGGNEVSLTADKEGTQKIATSEIKVATGGLANPKQVTMTVEDADYQGPLYIYATCAIRMFIGEFEITLGDAAPEKPNEPSNPEQPETGDFGVIALAFAAVSSLVIKKKKEI